MPDNGMVYVSEIFGPTLQGEGVHIGKQTMFIRTFGCDSRCSMCDSLHAVDPHRLDAKREKMSVEDVVRRLRALDGDGLPLPVTLSGGNPVIWNLIDLVGALHADGRKVWLETQGTYWNEWVRLCDYVTVSPKGPGMNDTALGLTSISSVERFVDHPELRGKVCIKVVVFGRGDLEYANEMAQTFPGIPLYLSVGNASATQRAALCSAEELLRQLDRMSKEVRDYSSLRRRVACLPQLHVLMYGNERGV